jgi:hypothetical protein
MKLKNVVLITVYLFLFNGCVKKDKPDPFNEIWTGMTKSEIVKLVGTTNEKRYMTKTNNQIQGPEKEFWHEIPKGVKLETWTYHTPQGKLNLYFIGKSSDLKYKILVK